MADFTFLKFKQLLETFSDKKYNFQTIEDFLVKPQKGKVIMLRHDVDRYPNNSLTMARLENSMNIVATYYFRIIPSVYKAEILKKVTDLGHEVSYHYEDLSIVKGDYEKAIKHFENGLAKIRKYGPSKTICMHGSPLSKWDNKKLWEKYDYHNYGIIGDTSFDIDYDKVFYITDNGWGWNNTEVSVRDKVVSKFNIPIKNTNHLIELIKSDKLPEKIMINAHPDTFFDPGFKWYLNMVKLKSKNVIKRQIVKYKLIK